MNASRKCQSGNSCWQCSVFSEVEQRFTSWCTNQRHSSAPRVCNLNLGVRWRSCRHRRCPFCVVALEPATFHKYHCTVGKFLGIFNCSSSFVSTQKVRRRKSFRSLPPRCGHVFCDDDLLELNVERDFSRKVDGVTLARDGRCKY